MACGCGGKKYAYLVTKGDGTTEEVKTLSEAMNMVRRFGGHYRRVALPK